MSRLGLEEEVSTHDCVWSSLPIRRAKSRVCSCDNSAAAFKDSMRFSFRLECVLVSYGKRGERFPFRVPAAGMKRVNHDLGFEMSVAKSQELQEVSREKGAMQKSEATNRC